jgi:hypothetical protein
MVESCSRRAGYHENSPYRTKESSPSEAFHSQGKKMALANILRYIIWSVSQDPEISSGWSSFQDTVEERMQQVQFRKQRMISGALTDYEVRGARIEHLKMLFT